MTFIDFPATAGIPALQVGSNVLAIHGLNDSTGSSDALWSSQLVAVSGSGNGPSPSAQIYTGAVNLDTSAEIKARVYDGSRWSPLTSGLFVVDALPASASNIVVS